MKNWWERYLGKPWRPQPEPPASYTCGELLRTVHRDLFGIEAAEILANPLSLRQCVEAMTPERFGLRPLTAGERPVEFDSVFMARVKYEDHCGIGAQTADGLLILHCQQGVGVVMDSQAELMGQGFRHLTWYRHRELPHA
jgi:hypothetical protein